MAIQNPRYVIKFADVACPVDERGEDKRELAVKIGPDLIDAMRSCLIFDHKKRATIPELLDAPFLRREGGGAVAKPDPGAL
jgi:serine/threonine-protein kinase TTK/MPS1